MADNTSQQLLDMWKRQVEEGTQAWLRMMGQAQAPTAMPNMAMDPQAFWRPFMDQGMAAWSKVMTQGTAPSPDLMAQWKQFLDQSIDAWSRALGQVMNTEAFAQMLGRYLDQWLATTAPMKKTAEQGIDQALTTLNVASRSQLTAVAKQIVDLEERVERIEEAVHAVLKAVQRERA
jgi:hypothetical protein